MRDQLASLAGRTSASFAYDALGRRVDQTIASAETGYLYDLANAAMPLACSRRVTKAPSFHGPGGLQTRRACGAELAHCDALDSFELKSGLKLCLCKPRVAVLLCSGFQDGNAILKGLLRN